jgi:Zn-dependent metalloprotease
VGEDASEILQKFKDVLLATGGETLKVRWNENSSIGRTIRMDQSIGGIPVLYGTVSVGVDDATGLVDVLGASFLPDRGLPRQPKISQAEVTKLAEQNLVKFGIAKAGSVKTSPPTLAYAGTHPDSTRGHLVWVVPATYTSQAGGADDGIFWFDAIDGVLVGQDALTKGAALKVYTGNSTATLKDSDDGITSVLTLLFTHPGSSTDPDVTKAYDNLMASMRADEIVVGWLQTLDIGLIVHAGSSWANARATRKGGVDYVLFGDGSGATLTGPIGDSRDAVAHEYGHVMATSIFNPFGGDPSDAQSAAVDEAFGDVNAALVDTYYRGGVPNDPETWTIAEIFPGNPTKGLRSIKNPKSMDPASRDWFPARQLGSGKSTRHNNATIMGHAFKLMANSPLPPAPGVPGGGFHVRAGLPIIDSNVPGNIPSLFVAGLGPTKTWNIFFHTFRFGGLTPFATLPEVKAAAKARANALYGPADADVVDRAFLAVGVGHNCTAPPAAPTIQVVHRCPRWVIKWPSVPGATIYHGTMNPVILQWINPITIVDGNANQCTQTVNTEYHAHVRACNGCGCSDWSNEVLMDYWPQCP